MVELERTNAIANKRHRGDVWGRNRPRTKEIRNEEMAGFVGLFVSWGRGGGSSSPAADAPAIVVGRIYDIEGDLLRYVPAESDWVAVVRDAPFGTEDTFFSGNRGMAELVAPNGTWIRVGNSTQIQFIALDTDLSEMDVAAGVARFYNKGPSTVIKTTSPFRVRPRISRRGLRLLRGREFRRSGSGERDGELRPHVNQCQV